MIYGFLNAVGNASDLGDPVFSYSRIGTWSDPVVISVLALFLVTGAAGSYLTVRLALRKQIGWAAMVFTLMAVLVAASPHIEIRLGNFVATVRANLTNGGVASVAFLNWPPGKTRIGVLIGILVGGVLAGTLQFWRGGNDGQPLYKHNREE